MEYMKTLPDKAFDLAIVDPPYGIGVSNSKEIGYKGNNVFTPKTLDNKRRHRRNTLMNCAAYQKTK